MPTRRRVPGFFATLRGAMSDIPSSQPVTNELNWVNDFNDRVRRLKAIVDSARPQISQLVAGTLPENLDRAIAPEELRGWREQVNSHCARDAGFAYQAYVRLKLASVRAFGATLIVKLRGADEQSPLARVVAEIIDAWAIRKGIVYERADSSALEFDAPMGNELPPWVRYLLAFDVKYRERRLHFLIEGQNRLYELIDHARFAGLEPLVVDRLKREFYARLDGLRRRDSADYYSGEVRSLVMDIIPEAPSAEEARNMRAYAEQFVEPQLPEARPLDRAARGRDQARRHHPRPRRTDRLTRPGEVASRRAARGAGQLSWFPVLGRADLPDDKRARGR